MANLTPSLLEMIDELPDREVFHLVDVMMEGLVDISPRRMQRLLEYTRSVKVKRLFFYFADRHQHAWLSHIAQEKITLGRGNRVLINGGMLDPKYKITVPQE